MHASLSHTHTHTHTGDLLHSTSLLFFLFLQLRSYGSCSIHWFTGQSKHPSYPQWSRLFTVSGEWQPGMNCASQSVVSFGHFLKTLHKTCNEQRPGKAAEGSLLLQATLGYIKNALSNRWMMSAFLMWCFWEFFDILHDISIILFLGELWRLLR